MIEIGYKLSSEEFGPAELVEQAVRAEASGFAFALASDHFHPWNDRQGQSPFVWTVLGAIGRATSRLRVGTAVTCPTIRTHPAIIAHAAATTAALMPGRFVLGVGTGENLNEHVVAKGWPSADVRLEMLEEAIEVIRLLWQGGVQSHRGRYYTVEDARLYTLPDEPPPIMVGASKPRAVELAARLGDALINSQPDAGLVERFAAAGGEEKPRYVEISVCWDEDEKRARKTAHEVWGLAGLPGALMTELALPAQFEQAFGLVTEDQVASSVVCGPDAARHVEAIEQAAEAGYTHVCVHQIGADQEGFFSFYERDVLPRFADRRSRGLAERGAGAPRGSAPARGRGKAKKAGAQRSG